MRCEILKTIQQQATPLSNLFFSDLNINTLQKGIKQKFKNDTGLAIDNQDQNDLLVIMRSVYIDNSMTPSQNVCEQVKWMNGRVIEHANQQISTGVSQQIDYFRDASRVWVPNKLPESTSLYGKKMDINNKIGL